MLMKIMSKQGTGTLEPSAVRHETAENNYQVKQEQPIVEKTL
jgi:hypothetical protein